MKARAGEYRPKQTNYDIADSINRSFAKKRFIEIHQIYKWHGFIRRPSRKYDRLWWNRNASDFPISPGVCFQPFNTRLRVNVFILVIIQQNLGRNRYVVEFPDDRAFASIPDHVICGDFAITIPKCHCMLSSDETDWSQSCAVKVKLRFTDITSLLRSILVYCSP